MDVFDAVRTVLAARAYQDRPVPPDAVRRLAEAARLTGSSMNRQPWHFVVVRDRSILRRLGEAIRTGPYIADAPLAIVVAVERGSRFAVSDASRAIQSMILTAWDEGIGSNWTGFGGMDAARTMLDIPDEYDVLAVLPFGYPAEHRGAGKKNRKPLSEVVSAERFGDAFS
jgi:nitroreductase